MVVMKKLCFFTGTILLVLLAFFGCQFNKDNGLEIKSLSEKEFDSIRNILIVKNRPYEVSKTINQLTKELDVVKDPEELAKRYRLVAGYYMLISDYKKADYYLDKLYKYYRDSGKWSDFVNLSKTVAMSFRGGKRYEDMEEILKEAIAIADEKKVFLYDLMPIHELAVFYSYDVGNHEKAIKYGEIFLEKLRAYDTIRNNRELYESIKRENLSVINLILGKSYTRVDNLDKAFLYLKEAEEEYTEIGDLEKIERVHSNFIDYYIKKNNIEKIKEHKLKYFEYDEKHKDSLVYNFKKVTEANLALVKAEKDLLVLKEENKRKLLIIGTIGTILLVVIAFQRYFLKLKYEKEKIGLALEKEHDFNKFRASLFINIAHEIRTPLSLILGYIDLATEESITDEELRKYLIEIRRKSNKVINNISDIIALLKEDKKEEEVKLENIVIEPYLQQLFFSFESIAKLKSIELDYNAELPVNYTFQTNSNKLESLVNNLISNAIKFSPKNTKVTFKTFISKGVFHIQVIDEGSGISEENQKNIFSKFYQEEKKGKSEGFGIGLAIVKDIVDTLKGNISVESEPQKGSIFKVEIPIVINDVSEKTEVISKQLNKETAVTSMYAEANQTKGSKLLIVEDNPYMIDYYEKILSNLYNCTFAFNGEEGLNMIKEKDFDLVISDVMMPKMSGLEFRKEMKEVPRNNQIPFIMVTALGYEENKIEAFNIGVDDYIVKPFSKKELIARINCLLENKEIREDWKKQTKEEEKEVESYDEKNLKRLHEIVLENIDKENFSVAGMAEEVNFSQRQLERIIKKLTGLTPVKFILEIRLQEAYKKIKNKEEADVNNIRYAVGIKSASYFSVKFKERFGISPSELLKGD